MWCHVRLRWGKTRERENSTINRIVLAQTLEEEMMWDDVFSSFLLPFTQDLMFEICAKCFHAWNHHRHLTCTPRSILLFFQEWHPHHQEGWECLLMFTLMIIVIFLNFVEWKKKREDDKWMDVFGIWYEREHKRKLIKQLGEDGTHEMIIMSEMCSQLSSMIIRRQE